MIISGLKLDHGVLIVLPGDRLVQCMMYRCDIEDSRADVGYASECSFVNCTFKRPEPAQNAPSH